MRDSAASCWLYRRAGVAALIAIALFAVLGLLVATGATTALDIYADDLAEGWRSDRVVQAARVATALGTAPYLVGVALIASLLAARQGRRSEAILPFLPLAGEWIGNALIKGTFHRQRPTEETWPPGFFGTDQFSFPSGHAMASMALYSLLACWAWAYAPAAWRLPLTVATLLMPVAIGLSRVVLGVHWLSDVTGGWLAGIAVMSIVVVLWTARRGPGFLDARA